MKPPIEVGFDGRYGTKKCVYFSGHAPAVPCDIGPVTEASVAEALVTEALVTEALVADVNGFITTRKLPDRLWWFGRRLFLVLRLFFSRFF